MAYLNVSTYVSGKAAIIEFITTNRESRSLVQIYYKQERNWSENSLEMLIKYNIQLSNHNSWRCDFITMDILDHPPNIAKLIWGRENC